MTTVNIEPIITHTLLASKLTLRFQNEENNANNEINILINCGWSLDFDEGDLEAYKKTLDNVDLILITDGDFEHVGAILWLLSTLRDQKSTKHHIANHPTILSTEASYKFARAALIDVLENVTFTNNFKYYEVKDLDAFHTQCSKLRYKETHCYSKSFNNTNVKISCRPINNGCSIGGALWVIDVGFSSIICGDDFRMYSSVLLNPIDLDHIARPDVLIINHESSKVREEEKTNYKGREKIYQFHDLDLLINKMVGTLNDGGSVLIPSNIDHTLINLLVTLNFVWATADLSHYKIVLVSPVADKILLLVGTCLEYMKSNLYHNFIKTLWNPLQNINHITPLTSLNLLSKYQYAPTIFISTCNSIHFGFTSFLFVSLASYHKNLIILSKPIDGILKYVPNADVDGMDRVTDSVEKSPFVLQLNLQSNISDSLNVKNVSRTETMVIEDIKAILTENKPTNIHSFSNINGKPTFVNPQNIQSVSLKYADKRDENYGLPFSDSVTNINMNPYNRLDTNAANDTTQSSTTEFSQKDYLKYVSVMDDYYRKYLEIKTKDSSLFDIEDEFTGVHKPKTKDKPQIIVKTFPFVLKCPVFLTSCFNILPNDLQLPSLLHHILPRNVILFPKRTIHGKSLKIETYISKFQHHTLLHSFAKGQTSTEIENTKSQISASSSGILSLYIDTFNFPVQLDDGIIVLLRKIMDSSRFGNLERPTKNSRYEKIGFVIKSINSWKVRHNQQFICQVLGKFEQIENLSHEATFNTISNSLCSRTFWSEKMDSPPKMKLNTDIEEFTDVNNNAKMGLCKTQLVGDINISTYTSFMDDCIPNYISVYSGITNVNQKVKVTKSTLSYGRKGWTMEGTLDPSYYLARKILYKLHSKIEPIY
ncbi:hypothetical protein BEWA_018780 [Theileria equi strain WA]|uniref:Cleavage and polyadenylation specificity factor subunit 2 n=1 Tax=Theileria equi strain WA TaxID=1537102 RepID=L0AUW8_THEEQ|nr:hypothetical protein BEWA_018780 [Theileria equi strain WA]AFZ79033.1 hypothetical protein BEWA_018780 [Theileria equi strain WA]|eukprot:XP_004828699.1 hypothetical protein BEWA_018780 [Theileria equi strain WA]